MQYEIVIRRKYFSKILKYLPDNFSDSTSVKKGNLINAPDKQIWKFAKNNNYIIVTQDSDFNDLNSLYGFPPKLWYSQFLKWHSIALN